MAIKILLADDSLTIQKVVELTFSDAETRLMAVGSGDRAVQALDDFQPDIVLADVVMPGLTGYDVCEVVKNRPGGAFTPVVLLTGTFEPFDRARAERVGSDAIVTKPFDSHALQGLVRDLVARARSAREEAEAAAALTPLAPPAPPPVPEPPPTMILSASELEAVLAPQAPPAEDTGATQAMPALVLPEAFPPPFAEEEPIQPVEASEFRTMAMKIPTEEELAAAAPKTEFEPAPSFVPPPPPPPPAFYEPEPLSLAPPPPSPFYRPEAPWPVPPPPPAFSEPEPAVFVPPPPPPPPAFYEREVEVPVEPAAPFEIVPEAEAAPVPDEIEVALFEEARDAAPLGTVPVGLVAAELEEPLVAEEPAFDLVVEEPAAPPTEPIPEANAAIVAETVVEPFPEMDEPVPGAETETAPWDEGPAVEIPPPPPELSGLPEETDGNEPITRDIEADLEAFEASGRVRRRPEIWERHAALLGEEPPGDIDMPDAVAGEVSPLQMADPSSSELEAMAAAARIEDLSALIPSSQAPVMPAALAAPPSSQGMRVKVETVEMVETVETVDRVETAEAVEATAPIAAAAAYALSDSDVDRIARRVVQLLSDKAVRDIAWEVVPEYAERLVRERIAEVERAG